MAGITTAPGNDPGRNDRNATKPWPIETQRAQLLTGIEENPTTTTHNRFPARRYYEECTRHPAGAQS